MSYTITQPCCNDAACVDVCPADCIHPRPEDPAFAQAEMLYIDPARCIDCDACRTACPVDAIHPSELLPPDLREYARINAAYFNGRPTAAPSAPRRIRPLDGRRPGHDDARPLRVAIVGAGPAGLYAAEHLLELDDVRCEIEVFDRLPTPHGLVRAGVAPDHQQTRLVERVFRRIADRPGFRYHLNVEIGRDLQHADLAEHHHAVIYACGAPLDRGLGVSGEHLPGSYGAGRFVGWLNGHPDARDLGIDLTAPRAVVVGTGNVALDVARVLLGGAPRLARTDIADHALAALGGSSIDEVVVLGRRGPEHAAFTTPELLGLRDLADVQIDVAPPESLRDTRAQSTKLEALRRIAASTSQPRPRRLVLRFLAAPVELLGTDRVEGVRIVHNERHGTSGSVRPTSHGEVVEAGLVVSAIGFVPDVTTGLPLDPATGTVAHEQGRVLGAAGTEPIPGTYVTGWMKRGPSGSIGTNRACARETVERLVEDHRAGDLPQPRGDGTTLQSLLAARHPEALSADAWRRIDHHEVQAGRPAGRPRVKLASWPELLTVAQR